MYIAHCELISNWLHLGKKFPRSSKPVNFSNATFTWQYRSTWTGCPPTIFKSNTRYVFLLFFIHRPHPDPLLVNDLITKPFTYTPIPHQPSSSFCVTETQTHFNTERKGETRHSKIIASSLGTYIASPIQQVNSEKFSLKHNPIHKSSGRRPLIL